VVQKEKGQLAAKNAETGSKKKVIEGGKKTEIKKQLHS